MIDWAPGNFPVIGTKSGTVYIFDLSLQSSNSSVLMRSLREPLKSPCTLPKNEASYLKSIIYEEVISLSQNENFDKLSRNEFGELIRQESQDLFDQQIRNHFELLHDGLVDLLSNEKTSIEKRCLEISKYFSDETGVKFWNLASIYLQKFKHQKFQKEFTEIVKKESTVTIIPTSSETIEE
jgi:hypothetical protein